MPAPYGVTDAGFSAKTLEEALVEGENLLKGIFGEQINLNPESRFGQLAAAYAERERRFWEVQQAVHGARDPDNASGTNLDSVCGLTGTQRSAVSFSTASIVAAGTAGTVLLVGRVLQVQQSGAKFATLAEATIAAVTAWTGATAYTLGQRRKNGSHVYEVTTAGTSAASGGPTGTTSSIPDGAGTLVWTWIGTGTGAVDVEVKAQEQGVEVAPARTLTVIVTAVSGWSTALNLLDATVGKELETDPHLRLKRQAQLGAQGKAHLEAIRANVLKVDEGTNDPVTECIVFENTTLATVDGIPGKAVEALVSGGSDAGIRAALFASVAAGIEIHGTTSGTVTDSQGINHTVKHTRPTSILAYIRVDAEIFADKYPADGDDQIAEAIALWWATVRRAGKNLVPSQISAQVQPISGVDAVTIKVDDVDPPVSTSALLIALREVGEVDTSRIDVHTSAATP